MMKTRGVSVDGRDGKPFVVTEGGGLILSNTYSSVHTFSLLYFVLEYWSQIFSLFFLSKPDHSSHTFPHLLDVLTIILTYYKKRVVLSEDRSLNQGKKVEPYEQGMKAVTSCPMSTMISYVAGNPRGPRPPPLVSTTGVPSCAAIYGTAKSLHQTCGFYGPEEDCMLRRSKLLDI